MNQTKQRKAEIDKLYRAGKKQCSRCLKLKPLSEYYPDTSKKLGVRSECMACNNACDTRKEYRRNWTLKQYGIDLDQYNALCEQQNHQCAICSKVVDKLHVDHDHKTGKVRELLCMHCNTALGKFNDDVILMQRAIEYLKKHL
jgi:N12 class adenine-specific DNA methylase